MCGPLVTSLRQQNKILKAISARKVTKWLCPDSDTLSPSYPVYVSSGIGFKSVFLVTDTPHIWSGPYQFFFESDLIADGRLPFVVTYKSEPASQELPRFHDYFGNHGTSFWLPLKEVSTGSV